MLVGVKISPLQRTLQKNDNHSNTFQGERTIRHVNMTTTLLKSSRVNSEYSNIAKRIASAPEHLLSPSKLPFPSLFPRTRSWSRWTSRLLPAFPSLYNNGHDSEGKDAEILVPLSQNAIVFTNGLHAGGYANLPKFKLKNKRDTSLQIPNTIAEACRTFLVTWSVRRFFCFTVVQYNITLKKAGGRYQRKFPTKRKNIGW